MGRHDATGRLGMLCKLNLKIAETMAKVLNISLA